MSESEANGNSPAAETSDAPGIGDLSLGENESAIEAPKPRKPRSAAQIAAFEKCRAARQANRSKVHGDGKPVKKEPEPEPSRPEPSRPEPEARKPRKGRSDKGKKRGYLVKHRPPTPPSSDSDSDSSEDEHPTVFQFNVV